jgi:aminocarboxymuconate-semialdehyde decarboxylase
MQRPPSEYLRRFSYDTIGHDDRINLNLVRLVGADRVTLGSDYCFDMGLDDPVGTVDRLASLTVAERAMILGGNSARLLRLAG